MYQFISEPWHWSFSGLVIALVMFLLLYSGKQFGVSSSLRTVCSIAGAGKRHKFFDFDWKAQRWNLVFVLGAMIGGFIAYYLLPSSEPIQLSSATRAYLETSGLSQPGAQAGFFSFVPPELFAGNQLLTARSLVTIILGGFFIGFGSRWAGGCTSGHAISGLSNLQVPSLIAVVGFFIGGLAMHWLLLPVILSL